MNEHPRASASDLIGIRRDMTRPQLPWPDTTQAAEGIPRRPWTRAEIEAIVRAGIIDDDERFELIGGEVVPMSPKGARHEMVKIALNRHLQRTAPDDLSVAQESTLWLDEITFVEPDFCIWPRLIPPVSQRGHDVVLAVEIADTSLRYDLGRKSAIYAAYGVSEVWVIDALRLVTRVQRGLSARGYQDVFEAGPGETVACLRQPALAVNLSALRLSPERE